MSQPVYRGTVVCRSVKPSESNPSQFYGTFSIPEVGLLLADLPIRYYRRGDQGFYSIERPIGIQFETRNETETFWDECLSRALDTGLLCNPRPVNDQLALLDIESRRYPD